jgi:hypothetical protein
MDEVAFVLVGYMAWHLWMAVCGLLLSHQALLMATMDSPKQSVLSLEPAAFSQCNYEITGHRTYYVCLGSRTLAHGMLPRDVWAKALKVIQQERERE